MAYCANCGQSYEDGAKFCPACGAAAEQQAPVQEYGAEQGGYQQQGNYQQDYQQQGGYQQNYQQNYQQQNAQQQPYQAAQAGTFTGDKTMAILAVIIPILFFLPLVSGEKNEFGKFWANQALLLLLLNVITYVTTFILIGFLIGIVAFVFYIMCIIAVVKGEMKPMPLVGGITIIK